MKTLRLNENHILEETSTFKHQLSRLSTKEAKLEVKLKAVHTESDKLSSLISKNDTELKQKQHDLRGN